MRGCVIAGIAVVVLLIIGFGVVGFLVYRSMKPPHGSLADLAKEVRAEGTAFGRGKADVDCIEEGLRRADVATDMAGQVRAQLLVRYCFETARDTGFCARVPSGVFAAGTWAGKECQGRPMSKPASHSNCIGIYNAATQYCHERRRR